ncbi:hypothetical protein [Shewanella sp. TC10]|uniref:hypothetical protein n=1 Tax=Shewanella sp. TC10 TaxID=1419739 RepID=UPI001E573044|nr:hypothetical protein [Shewanella sp. TC10]
MSQKTRLAPRTELRISKDGYQFDIQSNYWNLNKNRHITFTVDVNSISLGTQEGLRKALAQTAEELSADHTSNMYLRFQRYIRDTGASSVTVHDLQNWR